MDNSIIALIIFCFLSGVIGYLFHRKTSKFLLACLFSSITSSIIFQLIGFFVLGYMDPFIVVALIAGILVSFIVSAIIGFIIILLRK
jgi:hypothetical protein